MSSLKDRENEKHAREILGEKGVLRGVSKEKLNIDASYQRDEELNLNRVKNIANNFNWQVFGTIDVAQRPDGTFWVLDGQHRVAAAQLRPDVVSCLPCNVHKVATVEIEAWIYKILNTLRKQLSAYAKFKADLAMGDEAAVSVNNLLHEIGMPPVATLKNCGIRCVGELTKSWRSNPTLTEAALRQIATVVNHEHMQANVYFVRAVFTLSRFSDLGDKKWTKRMLALGGQRAILPLLKRKNYSEPITLAIELARFLNERLTKANRLDTSRLLAAYAQGRSGKTDEEEEPEEGEE